MNCLCVCNCLRVRRCAGLLVMRMRICLSCDYSFFVVDPKSRLVSAPNDPFFEPIPIVPVLVVLLPLSEPAVGLKLSVLMLPVVFLRESPDRGEVTGVAEAEVGDRVPAPSAF